MIDQLIIGFDRALRTLAGHPASARPTPGAALPEAPLSDSERRHAAGLMRVNHTGEVCAQALYSAQALVSRDRAIAADFAQAAREEEEHLAWTQARLAELDDRTSLLNPLWYAGSFAIGVAAGLAGDRVNLGFVVETERQVEDHLSGHLEQLPAADQGCRAAAVPGPAADARRGGRDAHGGLSGLTRGSPRAAPRVSLRLQPAAIRRPATRAARRAAPGAPQPGPRRRDPRRPHVR